MEPPESSSGPVNRRGWLCRAGGSVARSLALCACAAGAPAQTLGELQRVEAPELSPAEEELHGIFLHLAMALVAHAWAIDRRSAEVRRAYAAAAPGRTFAEYRGHNIGALVVNGRSEVVCFALNRSSQFNSALEHAEARAVRQATEILNSARFADGQGETGYAAMLQSHRVYTTLEPCTQCAGIMDLANIGSVVYAQDDPGQHAIAAILYNLNRSQGASGSPRPVAAGFFPYWSRLREAQARFLADTQGSQGTGRTAFLRSVHAFAIYRDAALAFEGLTAAHAVNRWPLVQAQRLYQRWRVTVAVHGGAVA